MRLGGLFLEGQGSMEDGVLMGYWLICADESRCNNVLWISGAQGKGDVKMEG